MVLLLPLAANTRNECLVFPDDGARLAISGDRCPPCDVLGRTDGPGMGKAVISLSAQFGRRALRQGTQWPPSMPQRQILLIVSHTQPVHFSGPNEHRTRVDFGLPVASCQSRPAIHRMTTFDVSNLLRSELDHCSTALPHRVRALQDIFCLVVRCRRRRTHLHTRPRIIPFADAATVCRSLQ